MGLGLLVCDGFHIQQMALLYQVFLTTQMKESRLELNLALALSWLSKIVLECVCCLAATSVPFLDPGRHYISKI
jgi:hypothetical protein